MLLIISLLSCLALGNIFNFLITLNAACNFILYCVLSDKYRQTVKDLFFGKTQRGQVPLVPVYSKKLLTTKNNNDRENNDTSN